jgi:dihydrofolate synthase/folylpolyglutamate synthase
LSYEQAITQLHKLGHELSGSPQKFDLTYVRVLLRELGNPEGRFKSALIAGTNGKGSTAATLASIVSAAGHRTGLYTSPHLVRINERIRVDGYEIADEDFAGAYDRVEAAAQKLVASGEVPWHPSFFEMLTAMAFEHFAHAGVEVAVLEVGMGGRLDATNVVDPLVSVITDISLDHQKYLGNTITEIAGEKAGIIRPNGVVITLPQHPEANAVIGNTAMERGARVVSAVQYVRANVTQAHPSLTGKGAAPEARKADRAQPRPYTGNAAYPVNAYPLDVMGEQIRVESPLVGRHQLRNVALAIAAAEELNRAGINIAPRHIEEGIRNTRWRGRFEVVPPSGSRPEIVLDGAHNPAGAWALRSALSERYPDRPITLIFGMMRDKAMSEVAEILFPLARHVIVTHASNPRSAIAEEIRTASARITTDIIEEATVAAALKRAVKLTANEAAQSAPVVVIAGSIYIVGEALAAMGGGQELGSAAN